MIATLPPVAGVSMIPTGMSRALYFLIELTMAWLSIGSLMMAEGPLRSRVDHCWSWVVFSKFALSAWKRQPLPSTARLTASCWATKK